MKNSEALTPLQLEILKAFSFEVSEKDVVAIRRMLAYYFAEKATEQMDGIWQERSLSNDEMDKWLKEETQ
ncbi:MAG: hypothetical protein WC557_02165 [Ignavibacteriaceae bacterium]